MVLDFLAITCWIIWKNRNKEHQNPDPMSAISTITKIMRSAMFKIRFALGGGTGNNGDISRWAKPPKSSLNFNSDVAWLNSIDKDVISLIVRKNYIDGRIKRVQCSSPLVGEALAILEACLLAKDMGLSALMIESDFAVIVEAILSIILALGR
ncbi:hypothetical protein MANES_01G072601v8 [Manihot esculenta]|uniref:Uncharacterized protein n=1 Tax=Manihot esculenta TaxID=3983 RepID=A0ACB7ID87_MANES|nr:hypothetical protein MANES_01G072601v8 [Manihot esculenta]